MKTTWILTAILPFSLHALANTEQDTVKLHEVEVIAKAKAPINLMPLDLTTVSAGEINRSTETSILPVLQNKVPGLYITERGMAGYGVSGGAAGQASIRGVGGGNKVLFMINGEPMWAGIFGHALPDTYVAGNVERVEVVSGPSSILYGSNAMGGSVNIITRNATKEGISGYARAMVGSYDTQKYNFNAGYRKGKLSTYFAGSYDRSNGTRENSSFWLASQYGTVAYKFSNHWRAGVNFSLTETKSDNPGEVTDPMLDGWAKVFRGYGSAYIHNSYPNSTGGMQIYYSGGHHKINDGHTASAQPRDFLFFSNDHNMGLTLYQNIKPWSGNNLSLGFDLKQWGGKSWYEYFSTEQSKDEVDKSVTETAGYAMMQQSFLSDMLSLNAGVRVEHSSQFGCEVTPQAGFVFHPIPSNTVKFSFGKGYRCPNIRELYIAYYSITTDAGTFNGPCNPDLKPEYLLSYELQLRQMLLDGKLDCGLSLYFIDGKDMIQNVKRPDGPGMMWQNTGSFINKGFELDANYIINNEWTLSANYAYLHTNTFIAYAPKNKLTAQVFYNPGPWEISLSNENIWGMRPAADKKTDYSLLNASVAYKLPKSGPLTSRVFAKLDNITNTQYEIMSGYPMPGFTVMAGLELRF